MMDTIIPESIDNIEIDDGITFTQLYTSRAGRVIGIRKNVITAKNIVGDKFTVQFAEVKEVYKGYYKGKPKF